MTLALGIVGTALAFPLDIEETRPANFKNVEVVSIYDGDTFFCDIQGLPDIFGRRMGVRLKGIDTPELRDNRPHVKELARQAKMFVVEKLRAADVVELKNVERGKYFRLVADVYVDGKNLGELLLEKQLAKEYDGNAKPKWD